MTVVKDTSGKATYYFYPFPNGGPAVVAKSDRPDGPFTGNVINWSTTNANQATGVIGTDPGVFWDPETGRVFHYQGIGTSNTSTLTVDELEPNMFGRKAGTQRQNILSTVDADEVGCLEPQHFHILKRPKCLRCGFTRTPAKSFLLGWRNLVMRTMSRSMCWPTPEGPRLRRSCLGRQSKGFCLRRRSSGSVYLRRGSNRRVG